MPIGRVVRFDRRVSGVGYMFQSMILFRFTVSSLADACSESVSDGRKPGCTDLATLPTDPGGAPAAR